MCGPLFVKIWIPSTHGCFMQNLVEILKYFQCNFSISLLYSIMLCVKFGWNWPSRFLNILLILFYYFAIISPWKRAWPFIQTNLILFIQGCFVPSLDDISPVVLEKKILKYFQYNFTISLLSPLGEGCDPSIEPLSKDALWYVWLKLAQRFLIRRFLYISI